MKTKNKIKFLLIKVRNFLLKVILLFVIISFFQVLLLKWIDPPFSSVILQRQIKTIFSKSKKDVIYKWFDKEDISGYAALAVIAAEDQNFPFHFGFDFEQINKVLKSQKRNNRLRGASTISQQVAKNLFLWENRSFIRKAIEAYYTILIESIWSKNRILEIYLNIAETSENVFGFGTASAFILKKNPKKLTKEDCALIAAVLPNPKKYLIKYPSGYIVYRKNWILKQMEQLGGLSYLENLNK